mmetsp:Transcript_48491/g.97124  ORF Transcript_48491/g.97124 Transcript_48491/m.97124 type:complete len:174 (+) Transcript_48491:748-1269(+)
MLTAVWCAAAEARRAAEKVEQQDRLQIILDAEDAMRSCKNQITNAKLDLQRSALTLQALEAAKGWRRVQPEDSKPYWWHKQSSKTSYKVPPQLRPINQHLDAIFGQGSSATRASSTAHRAGSAFTTFSFASAPSDAQANDAEVLRLPTDEGQQLASTAEESDKSAVPQQWWSG